MEVVIGIGELVRVIVTLPDYSWLISPDGQMTIDTIFGDIQNAVLEPFYPEIILVKTGVFDGLVRCDPVQSLTMISPERLGI